MVFTSIFCPPICLGSDYHVIVIACKKIIIINTTRMLFFNILCNMLIHKAIEIIEVKLIIEIRDETCFYDQNTLVWRGNFG